MKQKLQRLNDDGDSTIGYMTTDGKFQCYTLEDEWRVVKVKGDTRIPAGTYEIKKREVLSGLTKKYRAKYGWFDYHLELQDVPNFDYVYVHIGNDDDDTDACILVGNTQTSNRGDSDGFIGNSTDAYRDYYQKTSAALDVGEKVFIEIKDEITLDT